MNGSQHTDITKSRIEQGDCRNLINNLNDNSIDLILSDIPYGIGAEEWDVLHANTNSAYLGSSPGQIKAGSVFKKRGKPLNGWSEADKQIPMEYYKWCRTWSDDWLRVLKPGASVFIFAGRRMSHRCISALEDSGFIFKDSIAWIKPRAAHRAQRLSVIYDRRGDCENAKLWEGWKVGNLRPIFEPILWFTKPYKMGTTIADNVLKFGVGAYNETAVLKYIGSPNNFIEMSSASGDTGLHPTQKPIKLMKSLIELTTQPGQIVLDPFAGSGSTIVAAIELDRVGIGYEYDKIYAKTARERITNTQQSSERAKK